MTDKAVEMTDTTSTQLKAVDAVEVKTDLPSKAPATTGTEPVEKLLQEKEKSKNTNTKTIADFPTFPTYYSFLVKSASMQVKGATKTLLTDVSGYCKPGESLAIMGPSGAGKSTLLDILAYRKTLGTWDADTHINGAPTSKISFVQSAGYVNSDDLLNEELTTRETLEFYSRLRLPVTVSEAERKARIEYVMDAMKLHTLNIAIELLPVRSVLFLDEPTTGLDSNTGREIISNILEAGRQRKLAVIATIHQPSYSILEQFDRLLLLADGKVGYFGTVADAIPFFEAQGLAIDGNPAEVYAERLAAYPEETVKYYETSTLNQVNKKKIEEIHSGNGSMMEFGTVHVDNNTSTAMKNAGNILMSTSRIIGALIVGLFFGGAFHNTTLNSASYDSRAAMAFGLSLINPLFGVAAIAYWIERRKLYYHEVTAGMFHPLWYHFTCYFVELVYMSIIMVSVPFIPFYLSQHRSNHRSKLNIFRRSLLQKKKSIVSLLFLSLAQWHMEHLGFYYGLVMLECWAVVGFSLVCAHISSSIPYANAAFTAFYYNSLAFGGYYVTDSSIKKHCGSFCTSFYQWTSYMRPWTKAGLRTEMSGYPLICDKDELLPVNLETLVGDAMNAATETLSMGIASANQTLLALSKTNPKAFQDSIESIIKTIAALANLVPADQIVSGLSSAGLTQTPLLNATILGFLSAAQQSLLVATNATTAEAIKTIQSAAQGAFVTSTLAENVKAFGLPDLSTCSYKNGSDYLVVAVGFTDLDTYENTPDSMFLGASVVQALVTFLVSYLFLVSLRFQKK
ncbi:ATP-binding cassette sub- G member 2 [Blyttiomyces sp. JEL0837]|nr:ATP-binding cassette sub- G member 2 [Blyttiomyces sp. JEL0837]